MTPADISLPSKSEELLEIESRYNRIRAQARETGDKLKAIRTAIARHNMAENDELDDCALRLASGEIEDVAQADLPAARDLEQRLEAFKRSAALLQPELERLRRRHQNQVAAAIREQVQRPAVAKIAAALELLMEGIAAEQAAHRIMPGLMLTPGNFPGITKERVKFWSEHVTRHGLLLDDPKAPPVKARRRLFAGRTNGAAELAPLAAAGPEAD